MTLQTEDGHAPPVLPVIFRLVTGNTVLLIGGVEYQFEGRLYVAAFAPCKFMSANELEAVGNDGVIRKNRILPDVLCMARFAVQREAPFSMRDDGCGCILRFVARHTLRLVLHEQAAEIVRMAAFTRNDLMRAEQRECCLLVYGDAIDIQEGTAVVTGITGLNEVAGVYVYVAVGACSRFQLGRGKFQVFMARCTGRNVMCRNELESSVRGMVEYRAFTQRRPGVGGMAIRADDCGHPIAVGTGRLGLLREGRAR